jgi:hypothetical protein
MSPRENFGELARSLSELSRSATASGTVDLPVDDLRLAVSAVVELYALANEAAPADIPPLEPGVSTTDAVVMACALLKARDLNPFDLALWFSRTRAPR